MVLSGMSAAALIGAAPLIALAVGGLLTWRRWAITTAVLMLPYFSYGVMETLTDPAARARAIAFTTLTVGIVIAAFDSTRRRG
jgi:uncharacterized membrane protein